MKIYRLRSDANSYRNINPLDGDFWQDISRKFDGRILSDSWQPIRVELFDGESNRKLPEGDFPSLATHIPVFTSYSRNKLENLIKEEGEFLKLECMNGGEYYAFNVTNVVNALDIDNSNIRRFKSSGRIMDITKYVFRPDLLVNASIFKVPETSLMDVFVTDKFVNLVRQEKLEGFKFILT